MINEDIAQEILHQLFSSLEALDTQCAAILQFLKDKGIASEEELAVHFEQAGTASNVRWRAARVRIDHLISSAIKPAEQEHPKSEPPKSSEDGNKHEPPINTSTTTSMKKDMEESATGESKKEAQAAEKVAASGKSEVKEEQQVNASAGNNRNQEKDGLGKSPQHAAKSDSSEDAPNRKIA